MVPNTAKISVIRCFRASFLFGLIGLRLSFVGSGGNAWQQSTGTRSKVQRKAEALEDFSELLKFMERAQLGDFQSKVLDWCQEQGATSSEEVFENLEDLAEDLGLSEEQVNSLELVRATQQKLHSVCAAGDLETLREIVGSCDVRAVEKGQQAIHVAAARGDVEIAKLLLQQGASVSARDQDGRMPLHLAAFHGHLEMLELLMDEGALLNPVERRQSSAALHGAARNGHVECVEALLARGANRDLRDSMGRDPLHWACFWGQKATADVLIRNGANFHEDNRDTGSGAGPLHWAAWRGHGELVAFLIKEKADPNSRSLQRNTPLHFAAEAGHLQIVKDLLNFGSDPDALTDMGETPLTLAQARTEKGHAAPNMAQPVSGNHTEVVMFLEEIETDRDSIVIEPDNVALKM